MTILCNSYHINPTTVEYSDWLRILVVGEYVKFLWDLCFRVDTIFWNIWLFCLNFTTCIPKSFSNIQEQKKMSVLYVCMSTVKHIFLKITTDDQTWKNATTRLQTKTQLDRELFIIVKLCWPQKNKQRSNDFGAWNVDWHVVKPVPCTDSYAECKI